MAHSLIIYVTRFWGFSGDVHHSVFPIGSDGEGSRRMSAMQEAWLVAERSLHRMPLEQPWPRPKG